MTQFLGTHVFRLDAKGRLSIPARFRAALERVGTDELVLRPSHLMACIECWPLPAFENLASGVTRLNAFSEEADDLSAVLFSQSQNVRPDAEGRLVLPRALAQHAGLGEEVALVGSGAMFQIWQPDAASRRAEEAMRRARERGLTLPPRGGA